MAPPRMRMRLRPHRAAAPHACAALRRTTTQELFLQEVAERAYEASSTAQEKRQLDYKDVGGCGCMCTGHASSPLDPAGGRVLALQPGEPQQPVAGCYVAA